MNKLRESVFKALAKWGHYAAVINPLLDGDEPTFEVANNDTSFIPTGYPYPGGEAILGIPAAGYKFDPGAEVERLPNAGLCPFSDRAVVNSYEPSIEFTAYASSIKSIADLFRLPGPRNNTGGYGGSITELQIVSLALSFYDLDRSGLYLTEIYWRCQLLPAPQNWGESYAEINCKFLVFPDANRDSGKDIYRYLYHDGSGNPINPNSFV